MAKKNKQKTFTRTKSPEQQEIELIMEQLEEARTLHALEVEEVPIRLSAELNDLDDYIHLTTTNKTKFVICTIRNITCICFSTLVKVEISYNKTCGKA